MNANLQELYDLGTKLFEDGKLNEAEPVLAEVIRINPRYADVQNKLGIIANLRGDLRKAAEHFEKALELNPRYTEVSLNLAITYNDLGEFKKAQDVFTMAAQIAALDGLPSVFGDGCRRSFILISPQPAAAVGQSEPLPNPG